MRKTTEVEELGSIRVKIAEKALLKRIGAAQNRKVSKRIKAGIKKAMEEVSHYIEAKAIYRILPVMKKNSSIILAGGFSFKSSNLGILFGPCDKAAVFLATIGPEVERVINEYMDRHPHYGVILDAAASAAAEATAGYIQNYIDKKLSQEEKTTLRYSPGYCDWPISEQREIFEILPHETIGVELSEDSFMSPRKSVSGVIGICPADSKF
ncbi:MAG: hypothetical protein JSV88_02050, partial [Candidatus Aminicenantes bacterium]